jgi:hypothetical protein
MDYSTPSFPWPRPPETVGRYTLSNEAIQRLVEPGQTPHVRRASNQRHDGPGLTR